mmetsp:Transcript_17190/g.37864  ORF Transcript_17190/g.37864 Transcript_17190/m.37864 type:complete len:309 (-) Transcript_17190:160-1086(-)
MLRCLDGVLVGAVRAVADRRLRRVLLVLHRVFCFLGAVHELDRGAGLRRLGLRRRGGGAVVPLHVPVDVRPGVRVVGGHAVLRGGVVASRAVVLRRGVLRGGVVTRRAVALRRGVGMRVCARLRGCFVAGLRLPRVALVLGAGFRGGGRVAGRRDVGALRGASGQVGGRRRGGGGGGVVVLWCGRVLGPFFTVVTVVVASRRRLPLLVVALGGDVVTLVVVLLRSIGAPRAAGRSVGHVLPFRRPVLVLGQHRIIGGRLSVVVAGVAPCIILHFCGILHVVFPNGIQPILAACGHVSSFLRCDCLLNQ